MLLLDPVEGRFQPLGTPLSEACIGIAVLGVPDTIKKKTVVLGVSVEPEQEAPLRVLVATETEAAVIEVVGWELGIAGIVCHSIRKWEPHPGHATQDVLAVPHTSVFASCADNGEIRMWSR
jgi:hypothetical protein